MSILKVDTIDTTDGSGNITVSRPLSGSGASLTNLPAANLTGTLPAIDGASLTGISTGAKGADIASAATVVVGTDGGYFDITGTTGIATMTVAAGRMFTLQFDGAVVLTNSSTLKLSGAANFTTAAGDHLTFISVAANDVRQVGFGLTDGGSPVVAAGGKVLQVIQSGDMSAIFVSTSQTYADVGITLNITPSATSSKILLQLSGNFWCSQTGADYGNGPKMKMLRDSTQINEMKRYLSALSLRGPHALRGWF